MFYQRGINVVPRSDFHSLVWSASLPNCIGTTVEVIGNQNQTIIIKAIHNCLLCPILE